MANEFVAKNGLISQNNTTISGSLTVSASSGIPLQIKGGTGTLLSVSSSTSEIFKISDTFSPNLFTVTTGSIAVFNIDNTNKVIISGSLISTNGVTGSLQGTASFAITSSYAITSSVASSVVGATPTEIGYLSGVTSGIQTQLNSKGYTIAVTATVTNMTAGQVYHFGNVGRVPSTTANISRVYIPKTGTIKKAYIGMASTGAGTGTSVTASIRINNTAPDTLIAQTADLVTFRNLNNTALSISVSEGDYFEIKVVANSGTTPTGNTFGGTLYIE